MHTTQISLKIWQWGWLHDLSNLVLQLLDHSEVVVVVDRVQARRILVQWSKLTYEVEMP